MKIEGGVLHSPYFIFIQAFGQLLDGEVLHILGLRNFTSSPLVDDWRGREVCITDVDTWTHMADDWWYTLWDKGHPVVERLHKRLPEASLFACSVGECDGSFEFVYYSGGELQRRFAAEDPHYNPKDRVVTVDFGRPLPGERELLKIRSEQTYVLSLAAEVGVTIRHEPGKVRCYVAPRANRRNSRA